MNSIKKLLRPFFSVLASLLLLLAPATFATTVASNAVTVPLSLTIPESISLSTSGNSINLSNSSPQSTLNLTASWQIKSGHSSAQVFSWFSALPTGGLNNAAYSPVLFTTSYNGGTVTNCGQPAFSGQSFGVAGQNCGSFALSQNVATDFVDSTAITFTLAVSFPPNQATGVYSSGILNILFEIS